MGLVVSHFVSLVTTGLAESPWGWHAHHKVGRDIHDRLG